MFSSLSISGEVAKTSANKTLRNIFGADNFNTSKIIMKHTSLLEIDDFILNLHEDCERTLVELRLHLHYLFKLYKNNYQNYNLASRLSYFPFKMSTGCLASLPIFHPRPQYKYFLLLETLYIAEDVHKTDCYIRRYILMKDVSIVPFIHQLR